jgi:hypothetical protein
MPDVNTLSFSYTELITMMLKVADIHDGLWTLNTQFSFLAANAGPTPTALNPTVVVTVTGIGIQRVTEAMPAGGSNIIVDAAKVNPAVKGKR